VNRPAIRPVISDGRKSIVRYAVFLILACPIVSPLLAQSTDGPDAVERGRVALTQQSHVRGAWSADAYKKAGKLWGRPAPDPEEDREGYFRAFCEQYGLHPAPFENQGLPMGLRRSPLPNGGPGIQIDCLVCHGGSIGGTSYVGIGNTTLDLRSLLDDMTRADGKTVPPALFTLTTTRGTVNAGQVAIALFSFRNADMSRRVLPLRTGAWLPELDTPAWWGLAPKSTMYQDGRTDARSHRSIMQFFLDDFSPSDFHRMEPVFRDVMAYLKSIQPPKYPFEIERDRAEQGRDVFASNCAKCHGTYSADGPPEYPNVVVELDRIGTDPKRAEGISDRFVAHVNSTWFGEKYPVSEEMIGYQAPPLRGIWSTAPYLHNGSVPTLADLLDSSTRPSLFTRPRSTSFDEYDRQRVGWKYEVVDEVPEGLSPHDARYYVDVGRFGLGNQGHTFGDKLSEDERLAVIEYLKTL
jgi:mono/diheme cytochrome c family protein